MHGPDGLKWGHSVSLLSHPDYCWLLTETLPELLLTLMEIYNQPQNTSRREIFSTTVIPRNYKCNLQLNLIGYFQQKNQSYYKIKFHFKKWQLNLDLYYYK